MRIAITGASGNLGSALVRLLISRDPETTVVGISRRSPGAPALGPRVIWHEIDVGSPIAPQALTEAFTGCDAVVHLAWRLQPGHDEATLRQTNITGSRHVIAAAGAAEVPHLVAITSVGAYSPGPKDHTVDESWPTAGTDSSSYGRQKAEVEALLDDAERNGDMVVSRVRPGLVFQAAAAAEIAAIFLGPLVPRRLLGRLRSPVLPLPRALTFQCVHADDVATAITMVIDAQAPGAFNVAADPALTPHDLARAVGAGRAVPVPVWILRLLVALTWRARLQPTEPGWIDLAAGVPLMSTHRIRALGWSPVHTPTAALTELVDGMRTGRTDSGNPPLSGGRGTPG